MNEKIQGNEKLDGFLGPAVGGKSGRGTAITLGFGITPPKVCFSVY
jgi:hypothetical protein